MSIKRQVIDETVSKIETRLKEIDEILEANPLSEIIKGRQEAQKILKENKDNKKILELIEPLATKEKELFVMAEKQQGTGDLID